jgi:hypothetical protein
MRPSGQKAGRDENGSTPGPDRLADSHLESIGDVANVLNFIHIEGIVVRNWPYEGARFVRVACYPDLGRTLKRHEDGKEDPEYVTLRFEPALARAVTGVREGERIRAHGWLASREYPFVLSDYVGMLGGDAAAQEALREIAARYGDRVWKSHVLTEVVVEQFQVLTTRQESGAGPKQPAKEDKNGAEPAAQRERLIRQKGEQSSQVDTSQDAAAVAA